MSRRWRGAAPNLIPHSRARREEELGQLRRAGLGQGPVELEEARRLAEPVDLALAQRRRRLADVVEGGRRLFLLAITRLCANQPVSRAEVASMALERREI